MNENRVPPGQYLVKEGDFPVLDLGKQPTPNYDTYKLVIDGEVENPVELSYARLEEMATKDQTSDFHCVTTWSKLDVHWRGISWKEITDLVKPKDSAKAIMQYSADKYTTNVPLIELKTDNILLALYLDGEKIPKEHGAPARIIIPHLYGWKSAKFLQRIEFITADRPGFWEVRGYNMRGGAFEEERYS